MILWWILSFLGNFEATSHPVISNMLKSKGLLQPRKISPALACQQFRSHAPLHQLSWKSCGIGKHGVPFNFAGFAHFLILFYKSKHKSGSNIPCNQCMCADVRLYASGPPITDATPVAKQPGNKISPWTFTKRKKPQVMKIYNCFLRNAKTSQNHLLHILGPSWRIIPLMLSD